MKILVLVKEVPDTYGSRALDLETGLVDRGAADAVLDEICERAMEVALGFADANEGTEVVALSMGPESATGTVRKALAMGATSAVQVVDESLRGADLGLTARALAAAARRSGFDLVITGNTSTDGSAGVIPAMLAELLEVPYATGLSAVEISTGSVSGVRPIDGGVQHVSTSLPAVVSITEALPDGRVPGFKSIVAAKKKPLEVLSLETLGLVIDHDKAPSLIMLDVSERPPRESGVKINDSGDAGERIAAFLAENRLV